MQRGVRGELHGLRGGHDDLPRPRYSDVRERLQRVSIGQVGVRRVRGVQSKLHGLPRSAGRLRQRMRQLLPELRRGQLRMRERRGLRGARSGLRQGRRGRQPLSGLRSFDRGTSLQIERTGRKMGLQQRRLQMPLRQRVLISLGGGRR